MAASERDEVARAAWRAALKAEAVERLVFVDETGTHTSLALRYGWAPRGQRAVIRVPRNYGKNTTLVAALSWDGLQAPWAIEGAMDTAAFTRYLGEVLAPTLRPGQVVILDNLNVHHAQEVARIITAHGCRLLFLPAYSPDLTPIEQAFSKIKAILRRLGAHPRRPARRAGRRPGPGHPRRCAWLVRACRILSGCRMIPQTALDAYRSDDAGDTP